MTKYILLTLLQILLLSAVLQAQFETSYQPILFTGEIPTNFLQDVRAKTLNEIKNRQADNFTKKESKEFYTLTNYAVNRAFKSGNIYFNDELTAYVREIADKVLFSEPELRKNIQVYVTKFTIPNANAWRTGTIFINIGMLNHLENEAQLAFIIAHESAHIVERHSIKKYKKGKSAKKRSIFVGNEGNIDDFFELMRFSRTQELQADEYGLELFLRSKYHPQSAIRTLEILKTVDEDRNKDSLDLVHLMHLDTSLVHNFGDCFSVKEDTVDYAYNIGYDEEEDEEVWDEEELEKRSTHPSVKRRIEQIESKLELLLPDSTGLTDLVSSKRFERMKKMVSFELIEKYYREGEYARCLYESILLRNSYPKNNYLAEKAAICTYWLAYYSSIYSLQEILESPFQYKKQPYGYFLCDLDSWEKEEWADVAIDYISNLQTQFEDNVALAGYLLKARALNDERQPTQEEYRQFIKKYPNNSSNSYFKSLIAKNKKDAP